MEHSTDLPFAQYLRMVRTESATSNGISGIKLHHYQFAQLPEKMAAIAGFRDLSPADVLQRLFPNARYIWLTRRDKPRQAISFLLAARTRQWWRIGDTSAAEAPDPADCAFDLQATLQMERFLTANDAKWQAFFREKGIVPLVVSYEDLAADCTGTIVSILRWLGIPGADTVAVPPARLRRQSDARNEDWLQRYIAFKQASDGNLPPDRGPEQAHGPLSSRIEEILDTIPAAWQQWVGQSKLLNVSDEDIVTVLTRNGYSKAAAAAEITKASSDPYLLGAARAQHRLRKGVSILNALGDLSRLDSRSHTVERRSDVSADEFRDRYYAANRPVILTGLMTGWPAMTRWTPQYLKSVAGQHPVQVMTGREADPRYEMNGRAHRRDMPFADYIDMVYSGKVTNDYYLVANNAFFEKPEMQPLLDDIVAFPEYLARTEGGRQCFLWFGPAGTVTPLHRDTSNILIAQVAGCKRYRLIPASQWRFVYNNEGVFSAVDCLDPDLDSYPEFRNATIADVVIGPGEVLFMPVGWWHHAVALDVSTTVTFTAFAFPNYFTWE